MSKNTTLKSFDETLKKGNISLFGYVDSLPTVVAKKGEGRVRVFVTHKKQKHVYTAELYTTLGEVREQKSDLYFLDHEAEKVLLSDFPASAQYVCIPIIPRLEWIIAIPGLVRRLLIGLVKIEGIRTFTHTDGHKSSWLVLKHLLTETLHTRLSLSENVGVDGFLKYLKQEKLQYVVLRFFEKLPDLYRDGGDLDLLVADQDEKTIKNFLQLNPGSIGVDVWTVSRTTFNDVTYYPPAIAQKIIERAIPGPADSRIPNLKDAFLALAYHVVYHKGPFAGVPSQIIGLTINSNPENDYQGVLKNMAAALGIEIEITMESLDEYLAQEGWRPHLDTLAKIAPKNKRIWKRFFSNQHSNEIGVSIIILKKRVLERGCEGEIIKYIESYGGFEILESRVFGVQEVKHVSENIRGGVWHGKQGPDDSFLPAMAILVLNTELAQLSHLGLSGDMPKKNIRTLKKRIREHFDGSDGSVIHATDNTRETWEYMPICFPNDDVERIVTHAVTQRKPSWLQRVIFTTVRLPRVMVYRTTQLKQKLKQHILNVLLKV